MAEQETGNDSNNYYDRLGVKPTASPQTIRRAYRDLSKRYHPDTTQLAAAVAKEKFQRLNEAYATLSSPDKRSAYDYRIGISRVSVIQAPDYLNRPASERGRYESKNAYLDPTDRPLSAGELFALFILGVTFIGCVMLVVAISWTKGDMTIHTTAKTNVVNPPAAIRSVSSPATPSPRLTLNPVRDGATAIDATAASEREAWDAPQVATPETGS